MPQGKTEFVMAQDVITKDQKNEEEKKNRKKLYILECINNEIRGKGR